MRREVYYGFRICALCGCEGQAFDLRHMGRGIATSISVLQTRFDHECVRCPADVVVAGQTHQGLAKPSPTDAILPLRIACTPRSHGLNELTLVVTLILPEGLKRATLALPFRVQSPAASCEFSSLVAVETVGLQPSAQNRRQAHKRVLNTDERTVLHSDSLVAANYRLQTPDHLPPPPSTPLPLQDPEKAESELLAFLAEFDAAVDSYQPKITWGAPHLSLSPAMGTYRGGTRVQVSHDNGITPGSGIRFGTAHPLLILFDENGMKWVISPPSLLGNVEAVIDVALVNSKDEVLATSNFAYLSDTSTGVPAQKKFRWITAS